MRPTTTRVSIYPSIYPSIYLSIYLSTYLSIYLPTDTQEGAQGDESRLRGIHERHRLAMTEPSQSHRAPGAAPPWQVA